MKRVMKTLFDAMEMADSLGVRRPGTVFVPADLDDTCMTACATAGN